jgi:hypothetical protein
VSRDDSGGHPDLEALAELARGGEGGGGADEVRRHVERCHACSLEVKRLARFERIDSDEELIAEAEWEKARGALDRAFREKIVPAALRAGSRAVRPSRPELRRRRYLPIAAMAAAALILVIFRSGRETERIGPVGPDRLLRGEESAGRALRIESPAGPLESPPESFAWLDGAGFESYSLEIVTPDLDVVYRREGLIEPRMAVTDDLRGRLEAGRTYLWSVEGYRGFEPAGRSPTVSFTIESN